MKDAPIAVCPQCQGPVKRLLYPVGIVFKGSGWYVNDSRPADKSENAEGAKPAEATSGDAAKTEKPTADAPKTDAPKADAAPAASTS